MSDVPLVALASCALLVNLSCDAVARGAITRVGGVETLVRLQRCSNSAVEEFSTAALANFGLDERSRDLVRWHGGVGGSFFLSSSLHLPTRITALHSVSNFSFDHSSMKVLDQLDAYRNVESKGESFNPESGLAVSIVLRNKTEVDQLPKEDSHTF